MAEDLAQLRTSIERRIDLPAEQWPLFAEILQPRSLAAGESFVRSGEPATEFAFVLSGVLREFYLTADGTEYNKSFCLAGDFTGSYADLLSGKPSTADIEAITPARLMVGTYRNFVALFDVHPCWERLGRLTAEHLLMIKARREYEFLALSATQRYELLRERYPHLEDAVPQYHIASYLGITPVALSRIRARKKQGN